MLREASFTRALVGVVATLLQMQLVTPLLHIMQAGGTAVTGCTRGVAQYDSYLLHHGRWGRTAVHAAQGKWGSTAVTCCNKAWGNWGSDMCPFNYLQRATKTHPYPDI